MAPPDQCWEWLGARTKYGHGRIWVDGKVERTHRVAYRLFIGPIPDGEVVRHDCDNAPCWNPNHLVLGDNKDNAQDMLKRGRHKSGYAKLTPDEVVDIRERLAMGMDRKDVAKRWEITVDHVRRIEGRDVWDNAEGFDVSQDEDYNGPKDIPF